MYWGKPVLPAHPFSFIFLIVFYSPPSLLLSLFFSLPLTSLPFPCWPSSLPLSHLTTEPPSLPWTSWYCLGYGGSHTLKTFLAQVLKASSCPQSSSPSLIFRILSPPSSSRRVSTACPKAQKWGYARDPRPKTENLSRRQEKVCDGGCGVWEVGEGWVW